jgi:methionyl-tRNA formyltransferase
MPIFWALAAGDEATGVSVHLVDTGIDTGHVLRQEKVPIRPRDTEHSLYARSCVVGARLLLSAIEGLGKGELTGVPEPEVAESYHSVPDREAVRAFLRNGRRFFRWRELPTPFEDL